MKIEELLLEQIAEKIHDRWMQKRESEGWTYGPERNDKRKQTPCLVPYDRLPEIEKEYDRETARTTINALYELGFEIVPVRNQNSQTN